MKNIILASSALILLTLVVLGCGSLNPLASKEKPGTKPSANTLGEQRIGVPECDEVFDMMTEQANNPDDAFYVKAAKALFFDHIREQIRTAVEESKNKNANTATDLAKKCTDFKKEVIKYKAEEDKKKGQ